MVLDFGARAQDVPQAHHPSLCRSRRTRTLALQKLHQTLPSRSPHPQSPLHPCHRQTRPLQSTGSAIRAVEPDHLVLRPRKMRSGQRFSYLALEPEETPRSTPLTTSASNATNPISSPWIRRLSSKRLSNFWPAIATSKKAWGSWPLPGAGLPRSSFSASFSLPREKLPYPALLFDGQLENPARLPVPVSSLTQSRLGRPQETYQGPRPTPV